MPGIVPRIRTRDSRARDRREAVDLQPRDARERRGLTGGGHDRPLLSEAGHPGLPRSGCLAGRSAERPPMAREWLQPRLEQVPRATAALDSRRSAARHCVARMTRADAGPRRCGDRRATNGERDGVRLRHRRRRLVRLRAGEPAQRARRREGPAARGRPRRHRPLHPPAGRLLQDDHRALDLGLQHRAARPGRRAAR